MCNYYSIFQKSWGNISTLIMIFLTNIFNIEIKLKKNGRDERI